MAPRNWKRQGNKFSCRATRKEHSLANGLTLALWDLYWTYSLKKYKIIYLYCLKFEFMVTCYSSKIKLINRTAYPKEIKTKQNVLGPKIDQWAHYCSTTWKDYVFRLMLYVMSWITIARNWAHKIYSLDFQLTK